MAEKAEKYAKKQESKQKYSILSNKSRASTHQDLLLTDYCNFKELQAIRLFRG